MGPEFFHKILVKVNEALNVAWWMSGAIINQKDLVKIEIIILTNITSNYPLDC